MAASSSAVPLISGFIEGTKALKKIKHVWRGSLLCQDSNCTLSVLGRIGEVPIPVLVSTDLAEMVVPGQFFQTR